MTQRCSNSKISIFCLISPEKKKKRGGTSVFFSRSRQRSATWLGISSHPTKNANEKTRPRRPLKLWCSLPSPRKVKILERSKIIPKSWKHLRIQEIKLKLKLPCVNPVNLVLVFVDIPFGKFNSSHMSEYNLSRRLCVLLANDLLRVVDWINGTLLAEKSGQLMKLAEKCHTPQRHAANCCRSV